MYLYMYTYIYIYMYILTLIKIQLSPLKKWQFFFSLKQRPPPHWDVNSPNCPPWILGEKSQPKPSKPSNISHWKYLEIIFFCIPSYPPEVPNMTGWKIHHE